jgi:hypothetical protein
MSRGYSVAVLCRVAILVVSRSSRCNAAPDLVAAARQPIRINQEDTMGLFDGAKQAAQNAASMGSMGGAGLPPGIKMPDMSAMPDPGYVQMVNKIGQTGVKAPGEIVALRAVGSPDMSGAVQHDIDVTVRPEGLEPYNTTIHQSLLPGQLKGLSEGKAVTVKYDPDNPNNALLNSW